MILLAGLLDVFFRALVFLGLALGVGGVAFRFLVLKPLDGRLATVAAERCASLIALGAFVAATSQGLTLAIAPWALADDSGRWPITLFLGTCYAKAGTLHASLTAILGITALRLHGRTSSRPLWCLALLAVVPVMASGAWLVHGASRLENAPLLMALTVIHQLSAFVWAGGVMHLAAQWRRWGHGAEPEWPGLPARFSPVAVACIGVIAAAGLSLASYYISGVNGLVGTAYGTMLISKVLMMGGALFFGGVNFLAVRQWKKSGCQDRMRRRLPAFVEAETGIGAVILMAAAAFTAQPPAVDVRSEWATPAEVLQTFVPKMPQLSPAPFGEMLASASSALDPFALPTALQKIQSDFNHNISGIFVIAIAAAALWNRTTAGCRARAWPLLFLPFALFLLVFAEPTGWPLGKEGFWETMIAPDVLQHRLATLLVATLGIFQWRALTGRSPANRRYLFPLLCGAGGALLLSHSHSVFAIKSAFLIEVSHNAMAILAVMMGTAGWLELRLEGKEATVAGRIWPLCFLLVGVVLLFYREI